MTKRLNLAMASCLFCHLSPWERANCSWFSLASKATYPLPTADAADLPRVAGEVTNYGRRKQLVLTKLRGFRHPSLALPILSRKQFFSTLFYGEHGGFLSSLSVSSVAPW